MVFSRPGCSVRPLDSVPGSVIESRRPLADFVEDSAMAEPGTELRIGTLLAEGLRLENRLAGGQGVVFQVKNLKAGKLDPEYFAAKTVGSVSQKSSLLTSVFVVRGSAGVD